MIERLFKLKHHKTDLRTELIAGLTTFMTMAYIIFVNPAILSDAGMDFGAVMTATILSAALATILMGLWANYPFALAPGMGLNAFFAYTVILGMNISWQAALAAVFLDGIIFILLTMTRIREDIVNAIPTNLKLAVSVGIGLFIAFIGLTSAGIVVASPATFVTLGDLTEPKTLLAVFGLALTGFLLARKVKGALFWGILGTSIAAFTVGLVEAPEKWISLPAAPLWFQMKFTGEGGLFEAGWEALLTVVFTFTFVDLFDTIGTLIGVSTKAKMLDKEGRLPRARQALMVDAIGTAAGAAMGTSTVTSYVESAAGVAEGGRTGLTAVVTGLLFLPFLFLSPVASLIPAQATAPALILVGLFMMEPVLKINFADYTEAIPAFLAIIIMPLTYSIAEGLVFGILSYTILKALSGRAREVSLVMWLLSGLFVIRFIYI